jgi:uncharacterized membrane protein YozB (DUF420 family)
MGNMDLTKAALLVAVVFGVVELVKALLPWVQALPASKSQPINVGIVVVVSQATVFLVGASVWAHDQVIGNHPLDQLNVASKILVGVLLAGTAAFGDKALFAVRSIGDNPPQKPIAK